MKLIKKILYYITSICLLFGPPLTQAAPYFYMDTESTAIQGSTYTLDLYLYTDTLTVTAAQTLVNFDNTILQAKSISILDSECSFWAPADPSLGYGNSPTPYFYPTSNSNRTVFSCGFANPGYTSPTAEGDLIAKIRFTPLQTGSTSISFSAANTLFRYIGSSLSVGTLPNFSLTVYDASSSPVPSSSSAAQTPTPSPQATGSASPTPQPSSALNVTDTLTEDQLNFVEIGTGNGAGSATTGTSEDVTLEVIDEDDSIPLPQNLEPRPNATPFLFNLLNGGSDAANELGEVLSAQSLRELLIPGKSSADKTVVLVNLISTLTFLALLAIVIWRLVTITRMNRLKSQHMRDLLSSELAVLESKLNTANTPEQAAQIKEEITQTIEKLKKDS